MARSPEEEDQLDLQEARSAPPDLEDISVEATSALYPTEDSDAVAKAMLKMFPTIDLEVANGLMTGRAEGPAALVRFRRRIREMRIRDTARKQLKAGADDGRILFSLNKQSAFSNVPNFSTGGAPLGDIDVLVAVDDPQSLVQWLCQLDDD